MSNVLFIAHIVDNIYTLTNVADIKYTYIFLNEQIKSVYARKVMYFKSKNVCLYKIHHAYSFAHTLVTFSFFVILI